jgi:hypothetical protein
MRTFSVVHQFDGSWVAWPGQSQRPTSLPDGWPDIAAARLAYGAVDHFSTRDFVAFCEEFGPPPEELLATA